MSNQCRTSDLLQGKVLAALPWKGGRKTEAVVRSTALDEDTVCGALEDLVRRRMVTIDAATTGENATGLTPVAWHNRNARQLAREAPQ